MILPFNRNRLSTNIFTVDIEIISYVHSCELPKAGRTNFLRRHITYQISALTNTDSSNGKSSNQYQGQSMATILDA